MTSRLLNKPEFFTDTVGNTRITESGFYEEPAPAPPVGGRVMSSLAGSGGLAYHGGLAGRGGGLAGR